MKNIKTALHYPIDIGLLAKYWDVGYVGDFVVEIQPGFACGKHNQEGEGILHLRPMNIDRSGKLDLSITKYVAPQQESKRLHAGDVLFNNTNSPELVGKTTVISKTSDWGYSNHMTRLKFLKEIDPIFAAYQLHYLWMTGYYLHNCVRHVNQASVSSKTLMASIPFLAPPFVQQKRIVAEIEKQFSRLDEAVENLQRVKANLKRYKASVLKAAVEGKLTEQWRTDHPDAEPASETLEALPKINNTFRNVHISGIPNTLYKTDHSPEYSAFSAIITDAFRKFCRAVFPPIGVLKTPVSVC